MNGEAAPSPTPGESTPPPRRRRVWPHAALLGVFSLSALGLAFVWGVWEPPMGPSVQNLVTYSLGILLFVLTVGWMALYAPLSRKARLVGVLALVVPVAGFAAAVRSVEFNGDMQAIVRYRWDAPLERGAVGAPAPVDARLAPQPGDMPAYRGADFSGLVEGPPLSQDWETSSPTLLWRQGCGGGYAQFALLGQFLVTLEQLGANEAIVCYDPASGAERWKHEYPALFEEAMGGPGPRATPTLHDGAVYSVGAKGDLFRLALADGQVAWQRNILQEFNAPDTEWAVSSSPLIVDDLVVVNPGGERGNGLAAYQRDTGELVWANDGARLHQKSSGKKNRPGYASPIVATLHGVRQIVMFDGTGLRGYVPETGELLWEEPHENTPGVNVAQPLVFDDGRIFISCSYDVGSKMVQVRHDEGKWSTEALWDNKELRSKFSSPILYGDFIYGFDEGIFVCLDPATGKRRWKKGRYGHGQALLTNGQIVVHTEDGRAVLIEPSPEKLIELTSFQTLDDPKNWNPPALAHGILYVRNHREMAAFDLTGERR